MKDAIPADRPLFEIGPKAYLYGAGVVTFARATDRTSEEHDVTMMSTSPVLETRTVIDNVKHILVCVPHLDPIRPGRGITDIPPETLVETGVRAVMLNHAEHLTTFTALEGMMQRAAEIGLATTVRTSSLAEVHTVASLGPDLLVAEPAELIGTDKPSGFDCVEASNRTVRKISPGVRVLQGAGVSTPTDVEAVIHSGADTMGSLSAITTTPGPSAMVEAMIRVTHRGRNARPRS